MELEATKINDTTIEVKKYTGQPESTIVNYERSFIENQIIQIQSQKDAFDAQRDIEIQECNDILSKMDELGIINQGENNE